MAVALRNPFCCPAPVGRRRGCRLVSADFRPLGDGEKQAHHLGASWVEELVRSLAGGFGFDFPRPILDANEFMLISILLECRLAYRTQLPR